MDSSSGSLICHSLCPRHVGRNSYVPLFGIDPIECRLTRYYVIRDVIAIYILWPIRICITVIPPLPRSLPSPPLPSPPSPPLPSPPSLPLVTQQIHCPFQPKQIASILSSSDVIIQTRRTLLVSTVTPKQTLKKQYDL